MQSVPKPLCDNQSFNNEQLSFRNDKETPPYQTSPTPNRPTKPPQNTGPEMPRKRSALNPTPKSDTKPNRRQQNPENVLRSL